MAVDFEWVYDDEPHATRRKQMLAKYPEIKKLMGPRWQTPVIFFLCVLLQVVISFCLRGSDYVMVAVVAFCIGSTLNHSLSLVVHEISHNLAAGHGRPYLNRLFGMVANLPLGLPMSITFKKYHLEHHRLQGDEFIDTDLPTEFEARFITTRTLKFLFVVFNQLVYAFRPLLVYPKAVTSLEVVNLIFQLSFDTCILHFFGLRSMSYFIFSTFFGMGLHPVSGHFIAEHYTYLKGFETYSYYGPLNKIGWNVGLHNEHHDFPYIAGANLHKLSQIAPEYYEDLPQYQSWIKVIYDFIFDDNINLYNRIKRHNSETCNLKHNGST